MVFHPEPNIKGIFESDRMRLLAAKWALWIGIQVLFVYIGFGIPFFMVSVIAFVLSNLSDKDNRFTNTYISPYSVFNKGQVRMAGTYDPRDYDDHIRHRKMYQCHSTLREN